MPDLRKDVDMDKPCWKKRTGLEKKLIIGASVLGALALIFLLLFALRKSCTVKEEECTTKYCVRAAAELLDYVDLKVDPCDNFYHYTCGAYYKNAVKRDSPSPWTSTETLFKNEIKSLVVDPIKKKDPNSQQLLKQYYQECMNETKIDQDDNKAFLKAVDVLGGWPLINGTRWKAASFDWADWYIKAKQIGLPVIGLFHFEAAEQKERNITILKVVGPELDHNHHGKLRYLKLMRKITAAFDDHNHDQDHKDVHKFMDELYKHRSAVHSVTDDDYEYEETQNDTDEEDEEILTIQNLTAICPDVPWLKILNGISGNPAQFNLSSEVEFNNDAMDSYCESLGKLLKETHPNVIANFYIWSIIEKAHKVMDKDIRRAYEDIIDESDDRFKVCFEEADERFKFVKETIYVRKKTNPKVRADLLEMVDIMKELFKEHLQKCEWMDEPTKKFALEKVVKVESMIGAEEELYDIEKFDKILGVDGLSFNSTNIFEMLQQKTIKENHHVFEKIYKPIPEDWASFFERAVEVNAFFLPSANAMIIPAPILTSIFYNRKFPAFMNYGPMGSTVGHEMMHGFSMVARETEAENGTMIDWWTNATEAGYLKKVKCVIDEYEGIPFRYKLNGTLTLEENVADYVGADLGYEAYQRYVKKHGTEMRLPGVPLTPEQIYWVQTATNFCFRKLDDNEVDYEEEDSHAIPQFRVIAPSKNSKYFAEAFNCPIGSPMNPEAKCSII